MSDLQQIPPMKRTVTQQANVARDAAGNAEARNDDPGSVTRWAEAEKEADALHALVAQSRRAAQSIAAALEADERRA